MLARMSHPSWAVPLRALLAIDQDGRRQGTLIGALDGAPILLVDDEIDTRRTMAIAGRSGPPRGSGAGRGRPRPPIS